MTSWRHRLLLSENLNVECTQYGTFKGKSCSLPLRSDQEFSVVLFRVVHVYISGHYNLVCHYMWSNSFRVKHFPKMLAMLCFWPV